MDFKSYNTLVLFFSNDMRNVCLVEKLGKLDGIFFLSISKMTNVDLSKMIFEKYHIEIEPDNFRTVISLQDIDKYQFLKVMMVFSDLEKIEVEGKIIVPVDQLPQNCLPQLKWLIPLSCDVSVYGCEFNQILTR